MYEKVVRHFLGPAVDRARGTKVMKLLKELEATQWWPRERILALQDGRLAELVRRAYDEVPYYRALLERRGLVPDDIRCSGDLAKLPILTRKMVRDGFSQLQARGFPGRRLRTLCTGGSTGEPLEFHRSKDDIGGWDAAAGLRALGWAGYQTGMKSAWFSENPLYESGLARLVRITRDLSKRVVRFDAREISEESLPLLARRLEGFQGGFLVGYPTAIYLLGLFIEREGRARIRPRAIIVSGEGLHDFQRDLFSRVFECDVFSCYRSNEVNMIAGQCSEHSGYHISAENIIVEIVDDEGNPLPAGQEGRVLVTNLHSQAMPFIRYEMGDVGTHSDDDCPCGRGLPLLAQISGRATDVIRTSQGRYIPGVVLPLNFFASLGVDQVQIVQNTYDKVPVRVVLNGGRSSDDRDHTIREIARHYSDALGDGIAVEVDAVEEIKPTLSGKRRIVISHLPQEDARL